jgi:hypothetical protein
MLLKPTRTTCGFSTSRAHSPKTDCTFVVVEWTVASYLLDELRDMELEQLLHGTEKATKDLEGV